jgi:hypothetical protein
MAAVCLVGGKAIDGHAKTWGRVSVQEPHQSPFVVPLPSSLLLYHSLLRSSLLLYAVFFVLFFSRHVIDLGPRNTPTQ